LRRSTEFGNRKFSIFGRAAQRKWEAELAIVNEILSVSQKKVHLSLKLVKDALFST